VPILGLTDMRLTFRWQQRIYGNGPKVRIQFVGAYFPDIARAALWPGVRVTSTNSFAAGSSACAWMLFMLDCFFRAAATPGPLDGGPAPGGGPSDDALNHGLA